MNLLKPAAAALLALAFILPTRATAHSCLHAPYGSGPHRLCKAHSDGSIYRPSDHTRYTHSSGARHSGGGYHKAEGVARDSHGHIKRSTKARHAFERAHPCPATHRSSGACPGYVIDHVRALKRGGLDDPSNMQWQTIEEAKAKDKWE